MKGHSQEAGGEGRGQGSRTTNEMTFPSQNQAVLACGEEFLLQTQHFLPIPGPVLDPGGQGTYGDQGCGEERLC